MGGKVSPVKTHCLKEMIQWKKFAEGLAQYAQIFCKYIISILYIAIFFKYHDASFMASIKLEKYDDLFNKISMKG